MVPEQAPARSKNAIFFTGYQARDTGGRNLLETGTISIYGQQAHVSLDMEQFSFSTHAGHQEILDFAKACEAKHVVVYHTIQSRTTPLVEALLSKATRFMSQRTANRTSSMDDDLSSFFFCPIKRSD